MLFPTKPTLADETGISGKISDVAATQAAPSSQPATTSNASTGSLISGCSGGANVAIIRIKGMIYGFTLESLERRVDRALQSGATLIVIELDTYGGQATSAIEISKYLKRLSIPVVAWVNDKAYSAGIMIASACNMIVMSPSSTTGDCAPIMPGVEMAPHERAKALSPLLAEFRANAVQNGYSYAMLHATTELGVMVYEVEHQETGEHRYVNQVDYAIMVKGVALDRAQQPGLLASVLNKHTPVGLGVYEATKDDRKQWKQVRLVHSGKSLLTISNTEAVDYGLAMAGNILTDLQLQQHLSAVDVTRISQSWSESMAAWLTHPGVRAVLIIALLLGAYVEFQSPGLGLPGGVAVLALLGLLCPPLIVGLAEVWHIIILVAGFALILTEVLVTPGFGVLGISGAILMFTGLTLMIVPSEGGVLPLPAKEMWDQLSRSAASMLVGAMVSFIGVIFISRHFGQIPILNRLILAMPAAPPVGVNLPVSGDEVIGHGNIKIGDVGQAVTSLRPGGYAVFDGDYVDVVSLGDWIDLGKSIRVVQLHGNRIVVDCMT